MTQRPKQRTGLPDWNDNTEAGNLRMLDWLNARLDEQLEADLAAASDDVFEEHLRAHERRTEIEHKKRADTVARRKRAYGPLLKEIRDERPPKQVVSWLKDFIEGKSKPVNYSEAARKPRNKIDEADRRATSGWRRRTCPVSGSFGGCTMAKIAEAAISGRPKTSRRAGGSLLTTTGERS